MRKQELISSFLKDDKEQAVKDKEEAEKRAEKAEKDLHSLEERRERLQPVMDNVSKEIKEYGTVKDNSTGSWDIRTCNNLPG